MRTHVVCREPGCDFEASPNYLEKHRLETHDALYQRLAPRLQSAADVAAWREERRLRYPIPDAPPAAAASTGAGGGARRGRVRSAAQPSLFARLVDEAVIDDEEAAILQCLRFIHEQRIWLRTADAPGETSNAASSSDSSSDSESTTSDTSTTSSSSSQSSKSTEKKTAE